MDWIIVAGLMAISLVLCIGMLHLSGRIRMLEKEIETVNQVKKLGDTEIRPITTKDYMDLVDEQIEELQAFNKSYGNPEYTEWIDRDYDSKGVK